MSYQSIIDLLPELDALVAAGWKPCLNQIDQDWHVGLCHRTVPPFVIVITHDGAHQEPPFHRYNIHAQKPTLREAVLDALAQVKAITEPIS